MKTLSIPSFTISDSSGAWRAVLSFDPSTHEPVLSIGAPDLLRDSVSRLAATAVYVISDREKDGVLYAGRQEVTRGESAYPYAFSECLADEGFVVSVRPTELMDEIRVLLVDVSDDDPGKRIILERMEDMSRLELSTLLAGLKRLTLRNT